MQYRHQPGVCLADPQGAACPIEPEVMGQQHTDRLRVQVPHAFEVDHDVARRRLVKQGCKVLAQYFDRLVVIKFGQKGRDHEDVLNDLVLDASLGSRSAGSVVGNDWVGCESWGRIAFRGSIAVKPAGDHLVDLPWLCPRRPDGDGDHHGTDLDPSPSLSRNSLLRRSWPLINVPLVLPRSWMTMPPPSRRSIAAWNLLTLGEPSRNWQLRSRPMTNRDPETGTLRPFELPIWTRSQSPSKPLVILGIWLGVDQSPRTAADARRPPRGRRRGLAGCPPRG